MNIVTAGKRIVALAFELITKTALFNGLTAQETQSLQITAKPDLSQCCSPCC
ncbi:hypothetical protein SG34_025165 [Thalassomonas viridans]|uniref:Uncharacterized protein n=1 Tax=Thalassomonas viridans TaxID=137584 RepID=A0AAE9Z0W3_9GAMM|nr:hypothetical protein [Thalassomonas viridans]WDE04585.1 hypothetical protein SG34_025165 [Thalassomonas viridans]